MVEKRQLNLIVPFYLHHNKILELTYSNNSKKNKKLLTKKNKIVKIKLTNKYGKYAVSIIIIIK